MRSVVWYMRTDGEQDKTATISLTEQWCCPFWSSIDSNQEAGCHNSGYSGFFSAVPHD